MKNFKKIFTSIILVVALCLTTGLTALAAETENFAEATISSAQSASEESAETLRVTPRSYSTAHYHCNGNPNGGVVGNLDIKAYPYWRNDMTISVSGFSSDTDIRIIIKNDNNKTIFDTFDSYVGCLNTSGYYSIDVSLPASNIYHITCDIYGSNVTAGDVYFTIK